MGFLLDIFKDLIIAGISGAAGVFIGYFRGKKIKVNLNVNINRTDEEKKKDSKKGIILIISLYSPRYSEKTKNITIEQIKIALKNKDYKFLDIENSNLGHGITSILTHKDKLEHCWIIGSCAKDTSIPRSVDYEETFIEYLKNEKGINCKFHYGDRYAIPLDDDALICHKTYKMTNDIFIEAKGDNNLKSKDMIIDVTGGTKSMSLGLTLACLHKDRDLQIIGTKYDDKGNPLIKDSYPVKVHFNPKIKNKTED